MRSATLKWQANFQLPLFYACTMALCLIYLCHLNARILSVIPIMEEACALLSVKNPNSFKHVKIMCDTAPVSDDTRVGIILRWLNCQFRAFKSIEKTKDKQQTRGVYRKTWAIFAVKVLRRAICGKCRKPFTKGTRLSTERKHLMTDPSIQWELCFFFFPVMWRFFHWGETEFFFFFVLSLLLQFVIAFLLFPLH